MENDEIIVTRRGDVEVITIDRPEARNALTYTTYAELAERRATHDGALPGDHRRRPGLLLGRRRASRSWAAASEVRSAGVVAEPRLTPAAEALLRTDVPVIAAVNGAAVGWGMELAIMADIRVASEQARFGELFVKRGLDCDVAGLGRLAQLVGREAAPPSCSSPVGSSTPQRGQELRLVSRVVPHDELLADRPGARRRDRGQPAARGAADQGGPARALDPDWRRARRVGQRVARRALPDRGPPRGRRRRSSRSASPRYVGR